MHRSLLSLVILFVLFVVPAAFAQTEGPSLRLLGRYETGLFDEAAAEIVAYDAANQRLFFVNAESNEVVALDISDPSNPTEAFSLEMNAYGNEANSVAVHGGLIAVAVEADPSQLPGNVVFFDTDGNFLKQVPAGALPDAVTFTSDGSMAVVANEGEPNDAYDVDPEGSITIVDLFLGINNAVSRQVTFSDFNEGGPRAEELPDGVRIFGPNATVAQDIEPENVAISDDRKTAYVSLQENNALAIIDLTSGRVTSIIALGTKDHSLAQNALDVSNRDGAINIRTWPIAGMYMPDALATYSVDGETFIVTANEGDARDYDGFSEETRAGDLVLDPAAYPNAAELQLDENLGRLTTTTSAGDFDGDGDIDLIHSFGARSFSIWGVDGGLLYDSGDWFERILAEELPDVFNSTNDENFSFDNRSDDKGPEPEGLAIGVVDGITYAFVGLERIGGVMVFDISNPQAPEFVDYINERNFYIDLNPDEMTPETLSLVGDLGPEGLVFIPSADSPTGLDLLAVSNEISGTVSLYAFGGEEDTFALQLLHASDLEAGTEAIEDAPRFSAVVSALRGAYPNRTLTLSSGDNIIPGPFYSSGADDSFNSIIGSAGAGRADIAIMNAIGFDASAIGNHEFDMGSAALTAVIAPDGDYPGAQFPYLSTNLDIQEGSPLFPLVVGAGGEPLPGSVSGYVVADVDGERIGIIGATTPALRTISSPDGSITVLPQDAGDLAALAALIQEDVDALQAGGVDKIILVSHLQQFEIESSLAPLLSGVDIIVAGGSDKLLADATDRLREGDQTESDYPMMFTDAAGDPVAVVSTAGNFHYVGRLVVTFDADGVLLPGSIDPDVSGAYATDDQGVAAVHGAPHAAVAAIVGNVQELLEAKLSATFGITDVYLNGDRSFVRTQETNLGNLTADANLWVAQSVDPSAAVSIKNGGGIRDNIGSQDPDTGELLPPQGDLFRETGEVAQLDIENSLRFNNSLTLLTVTAEELLAIVEHGVAAVAPGATPGQFPQVSGIAFSFDPSRPVGNRVRTLGLTDAAGNVTDIVAQGGDVVGDAGRTIRLVTLGFLADGGDGYPFPDRERLELSEVLMDDGNAVFAEPGTEQDALAEYLAANFATEGFAMADVGPAHDERIQNLDFRSDSLPTDVESETGLPHTFALHGNYPNPFNPSTNVVMNLPERAAVTVTVFDLLGRQVTSTSSEVAAGASRTISVDLTSVASGLYFYRVSAEGATMRMLETGQMTFVK